MAHKTFISFKTEDEGFKLAIQSWDHVDTIDKSLNIPITSDDPDYVLRQIRENYLRDSTVTIFLIGDHSSESLGAIEQYYIKKELQASLYDGQRNSKSGILGVVLPSMVSTIFGGKYDCSLCGKSHNLVRVNNSTVIREFGYNYYIPNSKCAWGEEDRYCVLVDWESFEADPESWIDRAFDKRAAPIAGKTRVRPPA